jgi:long-chain acyl-CoA synthetase
VNVAGILVSTAARLGGSIALRLDDAEWSYRALDAASARVAALLRGRGVGCGDRVGVLLPNVPELAVVYFGILRAGGVVVPMEVLLEEGEIASYLCDAGAKLLFAWHALAEVVEAGARGAGTECLFVTPGEFGWLLGSVRPDRDLCERDGAEAAVVLYSAGTNGAPRPAELSHADLGCGADRLRRAQSLVDDDVTLDTLPLVHSPAGTSALTATVAVGGCQSLIGRFDAGRALRVIDRDGVTVLRGGPATFAALLAHPDRSGGRGRSTLRLCACEGGPLAPELRRGLEETFGCTVVEAP